MRVDREAVVGLIGRGGAENPERRPKALDAPFRVVQERELVCGRMCAASTSLPMS